MVLDNVQLSMALRFLFSYRIQFNGVLNNDFFATWYPGKTKS